MRPVDPRNPDPRSPELRPDPLARWLAADSEGLDAEAEAALLELFEALPPLAPPAGFADRVLARAWPAGMPAAAPARDLFASLWARLAVAASLVAMSLAVLWLPPLLVALKALLGRFTLGGLIQAASLAVADAARWAVSAIELWDWAFRLGDALSSSLATPPVVAAMVACLAVSTLAFRFLLDLISRERSFNHG
jgi:hypothetical protein